MTQMVLIMVDECGTEVEVDRYNVGTDLDEDYLEIWKSVKISKAKADYPEARRFYFEDRRYWERAAHMMMMNPSLDFEDALYESYYFDEYPDDDIPMF